MTVGPDTAQEWRRKSWLAEAGPGDQILVVTLRRWLEGPDGQQAVWIGLSGEIGELSAETLLQALEDFLYALSHGLNRQLTRHSAYCPCLGEDEMLLADVVRAAGRGDHDTAAARAAEVVRSCELAPILEHAARLGILLDEIPFETSSTQPGQRRLH
ncbi:MAG: hypothetical protein AAF416_12565 [Pseudomonadota bacterium]